MLVTTLLQLILLHVTLLHSGWWSYKIAIAQHVTANYSNSCFYSPAGGFCPPAGLSLDHML